MFPSFPQRYIERLAEQPLCEADLEGVLYLGQVPRLGIDTASEEYLAVYVRNCPVTPSISLDRVMKSVWLLEQMGRARLGIAMI